MMHILANGRTCQTLRLSDFSLSGQAEVAGIMRQLLKLARRNEHIIIRRPEKQQGTERGDGRKKEDWRDRLRRGQRDQDRERKQR